jgi:riboflavin kinase/FMN adenylyltransferase
VKVFRSIDSYPKSKRNAVITIGTFDGVHIGHQKIIEQLNALKSAESDVSMILTFFPHPRRVLDQSNDIKMLTTMEEKTRLLENFGLDHLIVEPFTPEFSRLTALEFVRDILVNRLSLKKLVIGYDHHFGRNREGNFEQLKEFGELYGFEVIEIPAQTIESVSVSSTKVRKAIEAGELKTANSYLGYPYRLTGDIVKGQGLGRKLNFPTINLQVEEDYKLIPAKGVYAVKVRISEKEVLGMMNIGFRPTVGGNGRTIEIHLLDFKGDLYGQRLQVDVLDRLRDEQKFESVEALTAQLKIDEENTRLALSNMNS